MKKIWKLTSLIIIPGILIITSLKTGAEESAQVTASGVVANAVANGDISNINLILSELEPKATSVCNINPESAKCAEYSNYVNDLKNAKQGGL